MIMSPRDLTWYDSLAIVLISGLIIYAVMG
jgi:hypothetical protein